MDRNFYYQTRAKEHQREIERELANRHLLNEAAGKFLASQHVKQMVLRFGPATIILTLLLLHFLG